MSETPTILAIETATNACGIGLLYKNTHYHAVQIGNNIHSQVLLSMVDELLKQHGLQAENLNAVAVDQGPGSFTGLRIGIGVAQGLAFAAQCPMIGVSSLDILANQINCKDIKTPVHIIAGIDARMSEIYWCSYRRSKNGLEELAVCQVSKADGIDIDDSQVWLAVGNAWRIYQPQLSDRVAACLQIQADHETPHPGSLLILAEQKFQKGLVVNAMDFVPEYVRNNVAKKSQKSLL